MKENIRALKAVLSGFVGIRKNQSAQSDESNIHPLRILIIGVICVIVFVCLLLNIVKFIVE